MQKYEVLGEKECKKRRTIADAIDVLHKKVGFESADRGQIRVGRMRLPSADIVSLAGMSFIFRNGAHHVPTPRHHDAGPQVAAQQA
jgi:hypothetical protein